MSIQEKRLGLLSAVRAIPFDQFTLQPIRLPLGDRSHVVILPHSPWGFNMRRDLIDPFDNLFTELCQKKVCTYEDFVMKKRENYRENSSEYDYVRKVRGNKWQARPWVPDQGHINLGLYDTEKKAHKVVERFLETGEMPKTLLPKYVYRRNGPNGEERYYARVKKKGIKFYLEGPYEDPMIAHLEMVQLIEQTLPPEEESEEENLFEGLGEKWAKG